VIHSNRILAVIGLAAVLGLATLAKAVPPPITDTFAKGDDGWEIYEGAAEHDARWIARGGNPGGFIRYRDSDSAGSPAVFADEDYVSKISRYLGQTIVFDLKTNAPDPRRPKVWITDPGDPSFPAISSTLQRSPGTKWRHYVLPIDARAARWVDSRGERISPKRFRKVLDRDPVFVVRADYSSSAAERTDFDSVGISTTVPRTLSLAYRAKTGLLKGRLRSARPECVDSQALQLFRVMKGPDHRIGTPTTSATGAYSLKRKRLKKGTYYALAPESNPNPGLTCLKAKSKSIKRK
jgi:hypothetical protein